MDDFQPFQFRPPSSERPLPAHLMQLCSAVGDSQRFFCRFVLKISTWFSDEFLDDFLWYGTLQLATLWRYLYVSKPLNFTNLSEMSCQVLTRIVSAFVDAHEGCQFGRGFFLCQVFAGFNIKSLEVEGSSGLIQILVDSMREVVELTTFSPKYHN